MAEEKKELSMSEIATHNSKDMGVWLVIKDMNDGGKLGTKFVIGS